MAPGRKKKVEYEPIIIEGRKLANTWWGKAWDDNLESYSDYSNRIGRGRTYVRSGAVIDLKIEKGSVIALVKGSRVKPYKVQINISPIESGIWDNIKESCEGKIESLSELIEGKFPNSLSDLFTSKGNGLFPTPQEITMDCSCPDWAVMCKHVAAVFYGIGARLDKDPALFFTLRNVNVDELITQVAKSKTEDMLGKAQVKSRRILTDANIENLFGLDMEGDKK